MSSPRVLQIGKHFYPDRGGIETVTKNISGALAQAGIVADVLCMALEGSGDRQEEGYRVMRSPTNAIVAGNKTLSWDYARQIGRLSSAYDIGILHVPNPVGALAALAAWRKPLIVLWHADFSHQVWGLITKPIDVAIAKRADAIVAPTAIHLAQSNRASSIRSKGEIIAFPFAPISARPFARSKLVQNVSRAARGRRMVLATGRLVRYKGFDVLIEAMKDVDPELFCVIAGDGPLRETLAKQIVFEQVIDRVMLVGAVSDDDMAGLIDAAFFGCLPSVTSQEMYGLTQVEMMAAGKPMVSTNLAGSGVPLVNRDNETGLLAIPADAKDLARCFNALAIDEPLYHRLAAGAARAYEREHSLRTVGERYAALIRRLADRS